MTVWRAGILLTLTVSLALTVVYLRAEQTRCAARALALEAQRIELRRDLWDIQSRVARLRAPERVHHRLELFGTGLVPPANKDGVRGGRAVASSRYQ